MTITKTRTYMKTFPDRRPRGGGLYVTDAKKKYYFKNLGIGGRADKPVTIGTASTCRIRLPEDRRVEEVHAILQHRNSKVYLVDCSSKRTTFADGWQVTEPVPLLIGMVLKLGDMQLVVIRQKGTFPVLADTVSELCRFALPLWGSYRATGEGVARSRGFVKRQFEPRSERYKKNSKKNESEDK